MPCGLQSRHGCKWSHDHQELLKIVVPKLKEYERGCVACLWCKPVRVLLGFGVEG